MDCNEILDKHEQVFASLSMMLRFMQDDLKEMQRRICEIERRVNTIERFKLK